MSIFVTCNDGGWHQSTPSYQEVAEAINKVLENHTYYKSGYSIWATEFKIDGYVIEVYEEKSYNRDKNIEKLGI